MIERIFCGEDNALDQLSIVYDWITTTLLIHGTKTTTSKRKKKIDLENCEIKQYNFAKIWTFNANQLYASKYYLKKSERRSI